MQVTILGRRWRLTFCRIDGENGGQPDHGRCDHPEKVGKTIEVNQSLTGRQRAEALIHACTHAAAWEVLDEEFVECFAHDLSVIIWRLGLRWRDDD